MISFGRYSKSVTALIGAVILWAHVVLNSSSSAISGTEWWELAVGVATALGVYGVSNTPAPTE